MLSFSLCKIMDLVVSVILVLACIFMGTKEGSGRLLDKECGISTNDPIAPNIAHGAKTSIYEHPWMVRVYTRTKNNDDVFRCGGTLITSRFVLTAAHCLFYEDTYLRFGDYLVVNPEPVCSSSGCKPRSDHIKVEMKIVHRNYNKLGQKKFDIGMFRMEKTVEYSDFIRPLCLLVDEQKAFEIGTKFNITGWGMTERGHFGQTLLKADVYKSPKSYCDKKFLSELDLSQICVGSTVSRPCRGDSGGPLSAQIPYDGKTLNFQFGLDSYGSQDCIDEGSFEVYTNVTYYMDWILDVIKVHEIQRATGTNWHAIVIIPH